MSDITERRKCEARTVKGTRCKRTGINTVVLPAGEFLCCSLHHSFDFVPAAGVKPRPVAAG
jgi:hypothetical protein